MNVLNYNEFEAKKIDFINSNGGLLKVETGNLEGTQYSKKYYCNNGEFIHEINRKVYRRAVAKIYNIEFPVDVELFESEMFNSKNGTSYYTYQKY